MPSVTRAELIDGSLADVERLDATVAALLTLAREPNPDRTEHDLDGLPRKLERAWHGRLVVCRRNGFGVCRPIPCPGEPAIS